MRRREFHQGQLRKDLETHRVNGRATTTDLILGASRDASPEEEAALMAEEKEQAIAAARARLLAALDQYKQGQPWGAMLHDLAVVLGLIDPQ